MHPEHVSPVPVSPWGDDDGPAHAPWLFDVAGTPIRLPVNAIGFRVRWWPGGAHGIGELVLAEDGLPLFVPRNARPEEFRALVGNRVGKYKLAPIDPSHDFLRISPAVITIREDARAVAASAAGPSADVIGQVLQFVRESNAHALEQIASLQRDLAEAQRQTSAQLAGVVGAVAGVLSAAGSSGVVKKTLALEAAGAGAPVTVQMAAPAAAVLELPRNAAPLGVGLDGDGAGVGGRLETMLAALAPLVERVGSAAAYGLAKKCDAPEEVARDLAGLVKSTAQAAGAMLRADDAPAPSAGGLAPRVGADLLGHVMKIQAALPEDDRAWVSSLLAGSPRLLDALKPSVAALTVEEGAAAVRTLRAIGAAMSTSAERGLFARVLDPEVLPSLFRDLLVNRTATDAIEVMRAQAARVGA